MNIFRKFLLGPMADAARSLTRVVMTLPVRLQGFRRGENSGAPAGGVAWPVQQGTHGDISFVYADSFLAEYDGASVWMLDAIAPGGNTRHAGAIALTPNLNVAIAGRATPSVGVVVRGSGYGVGELERNVFFPLADLRTVPVKTPLVAHHRDPNPNQNSTDVWDPNDGTGNWKAPLDDQFKVGGFNRNWRNWANECGVTNPAPQFPAPPPAGTPESRALYWMCGSTGVDPFKGHGLTWFDGVAVHSGRMAYASFGFDGPLRPSTDIHTLAQTETGPLGPMALSCDAFYTRGGIDAPLDMEDVFEPEVAEPDGTPYRVRLQVDQKDCHNHIAGQRPYKRKWHVKIPVSKGPQCRPTAPEPGDPVRLVSHTMVSDVYLHGHLLTGGLSLLADPGIHKAAL